MGIDLSRKTMSDWIGVAAEWLKPIYNHIRGKLRGSGYLQIDETPVRDQRTEGVGSALVGYLWVYDQPALNEVVDEWHTGRGAVCLEGMLKGFAGVVQCDGYAAYTGYAKTHQLIGLVGRWAHARRGFFEAQQEAPRLVAWLLGRIGHFYRIERERRQAQAGPRLRQAARAAHSRMVLERIEKVLRRKRPQFLPRSRRGKAIQYALGQWEQLTRYLDDGRIQIDNNLVENAVRPTCLGKRNWLFIGHPEASEPSAILYSILENCRRVGVNPYQYLRDVLTRLPAMKIQEVDQLAPANWCPGNPQVRHERVQTWRPRLRPHLPGRPHPGRPGRLRSPHHRPRLPHP